MVPFALIGAGWRAEFYLRIARACPERFRVTGILARSPDKAARLARDFGVPVVTELGGLLAAGPLFTVTSVSWDANPEWLRRLAAAGMPALSETPPATGVEEMRGLCDLVGGGARIQVAEQYHLQPHHAARIAFARSGRLGRITQAQVSAAHGYHGISLIRRFLGLGCEPAEISAYTFTSPLVEGPGRAGPPAAERIQASQQLVARFDFGDRLGVFDFTGDQYFSYVRRQRLLVRGERGEIVDGAATYLKDYLTPIAVEFRRHQAGPEGNLEGHYLKGIQAGDDWLYHNPLAPGPLPDDEIALGECLLRMAAHAEGGPPFYPLAEACQDRYLDILMHQSAETGRPVVAERQAWAW
ncbi:MAG: Gfo/Idh/MocA family oxidoreductase, partial [Gemmatimonadota bacterium]